MDIWIILGDILILLAGSLLLGGFLSWLGQSPIVGYLLAGIILGGPGSLHAIRSQLEIEAISELGIALLLFSLGLEFSLERLKRPGVKPLVGGVIQVVATIVIGAGCAQLFGATFKASIAFGAMISLSSTVVVLRTLMERTELEMPHGRNCLVVLLTQDMAAVPLALLMTLLAGEGGPSELMARIGQLGSMALALVLGLFVLNKVAVRALGVLTLLRNRELTFIFAVTTGVGSAWSAHAVGLSPALGAFVAGMLLGASPFATQIRSDIAPLRVVLLTLFFAAAGMVADPIWILNHWYVVAGVTALLTVGKMAVIWTIFQLLGHPSRVASATGLCLAQIGEFAFVLGTIGRASGVVSADMYTLVVSTTIVSFLLSAFLVPVAPRFGSLVAALLRSRIARPGDEPFSQPVPDVVIIGFGPAGQLAAGPLVDSEERVVVIDLNRDGVRLAQQLGFAGIIGDATQSDILEHARLNLAKAVVITIPDHRAAMAILEHVRQRAPHAHVVARSRHMVHSQDFVVAGANAVLGDEEQVGESLARQIRLWSTSRS